MRSRSKMIVVGERGAALVVALLVMLVLSAMGLVAMNTATDSVWHSGTYRVRAQVQTFSDTVLHYGMMRSGERAPGYYQMLRNRMNRDIEESGGGEAQELGLLRRGGYQIFVPEENPQAGSGLASLYQDLGGNDNIDEGLSGGGVEAMENWRMDFRFIVRDPVEGPRAPGYSDEYCYKRVTVASETKLMPDFEGADSADDVDLQRRMQGMGRHAADTFIGPIECEYN